MSVGDDDLCALIALTERWEKSSRIKERLAAKIIRTVACATWLRSTADGGLTVGTLKLVAYLLKTESGNLLTRAHRERVGEECEVLMSALFESECRSRPDRITNRGPHRANGRASDPQ
jgi:hypothetical protein